MRIAKLFAYLAFAIFLPLWLYVVPEDKNESSEPSTTINNFYFDNPSKKEADKTPPDPNPLDINIHLDKPIGFSQVVNQPSDTQLRDAIRELIAAIQQRDQEQKAKNSGRQTRVYYETIKDTGNRKVPVKRGYIPILVLRNEAHDTVIIDSPVKKKIPPKRSYSLNLDTLFESNSNTITWYFPSQKSHFNITIFRED